VTFVLMNLEPLDPEQQRQLVALGRISANMAYLELITIVCIRAAAQIEFGVCMNMLAGEGPESLFRMFDSVFAYKVKDKKVLKEFHTLLKQLRSINVRRNDYVHALWFFSNTPVAHKIKFAKTKGKPVQWKSGDVAVTELEQFANEIVQKTAELHHFMAMHFKM